jgi:hypothetical protein
MFPCNTYRILVTCWDFRMRILYCACRTGYPPKATARPISPVKYVGNGHRGIWYYLTEMDVYPLPLPCSNLNKYLGISCMPNACLAGHCGTDCSMNVCCLDRSGLLNLARVNLDSDICVGRIVALSFTPLYFLAGGSKAEAYVVDHLSRRTEAGRRFQLEPVFCYGGSAYDHLRAGRLKRVLRVRYVSPRKRYNKSAVKRCFVSAAERLVL